MTAQGPTSSAAIDVRRAYALLEAGDVEGAIPFLEAGIKAYPTNLSLLVNYANCLADAGRENEALTAYKRSVEVGPASFEAHANQAMFLQQHGHQAAAQAAFERALKLNPDWFEGQYNLANLLADMGPEQESAALAAYERALAIAPDEADAHTNYSLLLQRAGRLHDSLVHAREATQLAAGDATTWLNLAGMLLLCGEMDEALACAKRCVRLAPDNHATYACLAAMYELSDTPAQAVPSYIECLRLAVEADGVVAQTVVDYILRAYTLLCRLGQYSEAREWVTRYLQDEVLAKLGDARDPSGYTSDAQGIDKALALVLAGDMEAGSTWLNVHGRPDTTSVSQLSFATMANVAVPGHDALTHKCRLAENLQRAGAQRWAPPSTVVRTVAEVQEAVAAGGAGVWYLKDPHMQRGQGVIVFGCDSAEHWAGVERALATGRKAFVLQPAVVDLALIDGRKFGLRIHALVVMVGNRVSVAVFQESVLTMCAQEFSANDVDPLVQITCTSVQRSLPGYDRSKVKGPGSQLFAPHHDSVLQRIKEAVLASVEAGLTAPLEDDAMLFQMFGYDFLVDSGMQPLLLEINAAPQFGDPQIMPSLRNAMAIPMLNTLPDAILSMATHRSSRFLEHDMRMPGWQAAGDFTIAGLQ